MKSLIFKNQRGVAAVEFAMLLPMLAILIFGTIDLACLVYNKQILTNAAREGARAAIARPEDKDNAEKVILNYCNGRLINFGGEENSITQIISEKISETTMKAYRMADVKFEYNHLLNGFWGTMKPSTIQVVFLMKIESAK